MLLCKIIYNNIYNYCYEHYLSIYPSGIYGKKYFFSIVGKHFDSVVRLMFIFYTFILLVRSSLIF